MTVKVKNIFKSGTVCACGSKSEIQRALFIASLSDKKTVIENFSQSEDIINTVECLKKFSADIIVEDNKCTVIPFKERKQKAEFYVGENATLFRFLLAVCAFSGGKFVFKAEESLKKRPHGVLAEELEKNGLSVKYNGSFPEEIRGKCKKSEFSVLGNVSSQFISAILLASPLAEKEIYLKIKGELSSSDYVKITEKYMETFGVEVKKQQNTFCVSGRYKSSGSVTVDGDWSNSANFLALGAMSGKGVTVKGLNVNSFQGDRKILDILAQMGAEISILGDEVTVKGGKLRGIKINGDGIPDIVPLIALLGCSACGITEIYGVERLAYKESDRIKGTERMIADLGGKVFCEKDIITVYGNGFLKGGKVYCNKDHRLIMAAAVSSAICRENVVIEDAQYVNKSYPNFFESLKILGEIYGT